MLTPMRFITLLLGLLLSAATQAAPTDTPDESTAIVVDKNVLTQIQEASQRVTNKATEVGQKVTGKATDLVSTALGFLGVPYRYGGSSADTGFDCSGLVLKVYEQTVGQVLPRRADQQAAATQRIDKADLQPGDLVFFNTMRRAFSHVGIYIGDGKFVHAPRSGTEVRVESMGLSYWANRFDGARRVQPLTNTPAPLQTILPTEPTQR